MPEMRVTSTPLASTTQVATSTAAAPTAGTAVATLAASNLPAGTYTVECSTAVTGTVAAATETDNMQLKAGATAIGRCLLIITGTTASTQYFSQTFTVVLDGSTALSINAVASATASSVYRAQIRATRTGGS